MKPLLKKIRYKKIKKVNLFILGEQKCGTSSLHDLIVKNKNVLQGYRKECHYFDSTISNQDNEYANYHKMFLQKREKNHQFIIDSSPSYFSQKDIPQKIFNYNPHAKLILVFRNPIDRIKSAYNFYFSNILTNLDKYYEGYFKNSINGEKMYLFLKKNPSITLEELINEEMKGNSIFHFIERSLYAKHLTQWFSVFQKEQFIILFLDNLTSPEHQKSEIKKLEQFLNLELPYDFPLSNKSLTNKSGNISFNDKTHQLIKDDMVLLENILQQKLPFII